MATYVQRIVVFGCVAAAHVVFLLIRWTVVRDDERLEAQSILFFVPIPTKQSSSIETRSATSARKEPHAPTPSKSVDTAPIADTSLSADQWREEAKDAVNHSIARQEREKQYHSFELKPAPAPELLYEGAGIGIFDRGPAHTIGEQKDLGEGMTKTWISPYCYITSGMTFQGRKDRMRCAQPGENANLGDMFSEIKPKYLKRELSTVKAEVSK